MKTIVKFTLTTILLLIGYSCDIEETPESFLEGGEELWRTNANAELGVAGIYDALQLAYREKYWLWGEFRSDNFGIGNRANNNNKSLSINNLLTGNQSMSRWRDMYAAIARANEAIANIPNNPFFDPNLLAEAHIIRAFLYFDLIRVFGDVPLYVDSIVETDQQEPRPQTNGTTILNEVVIPDMLEAEKLMNNIKNRFRFTLTSIWAFQAKVYMWTKEYDKAKTALDNIVDSGQFSLVTNPEDWQNLFLNDPRNGGNMQTGSELILSIKYDLAEPINNPANERRANRNGIYALFFAGLPSYYLSTELEEKWKEKFPLTEDEWNAKYPDPEDAPKYQIVDSDGLSQFAYGDFRFFLSREGGYNGRNGKVGSARCAKYNKTNYNANFDDTHTILFRYSGVLLLLAEAENKLGNDEEALALVNQIREARGLPDVETAEFGATMDDRENYILDERQLELVGEGVRWWDLVRTEKAIEVMNPILESRESAGGRLLTEELLLAPIWAGHIIENSTLNQTPGY